MRRFLVITQIVILITTLAIGCSSGNGENTQIPEESPELAPSAAEPVKIIIGNLTDKTGVAASAMTFSDMAVKDVIDYFNEEELIPGIELDLLNYDTQYESSRFIFGYNWLKERGADLIWTALPPGVPALQARADSDKYPIFSATANVGTEELDSSYIFCVAVTPEYEAYTLLDWIANNDPDFPKGRPARIGGAAWKEAYSDIWFEAAQKYCKAHPDLYKWIADYSTDVKFNWDAEIHGLKDCDYVYMPIPSHIFVKAYRDAGYTAKFLGAEPQAALFGMIEAADVWGSVDGTLLILSAGWYNDDDPVMNLVNELLEKNYSETKIEEIRTSGAAYRTVMRAYIICDIIKATVERVGANNFSTEALVETAKSWSFTYGDVENYSNFTQTKRFSQNYYAIYEIEVDESNPHHWQYITRADPDWIPQVTSP